MRFASPILGLALLGLALLGLGCPRSTATSEPPASQPSQPDQPIIEAEPNTEPDEASPDPELCTLGPRGSWAACEGQRVLMKGRDPEAVSQHPMLDGGPDELHQSYLDYEGVEVIVLSKTEVSCPGEMQVIGTLRGITGGGAPGTKESYVGWSLEQAEITCL
ncbi:hypothetical protein ACNOYE_17040 [Nannocystaceae bacterium ST9]